YLAGQELALGPVKFEREGEHIAPLPPILRQQRRAGGEIAKRRSVSRRGLGARARDEIELSDLLALLSRRDQRGAAVELVHNLKDRLLALFGGCLCREYPANL